MHLLWPLLTRVISEFISQIIMFRYIVLVVSIFSFLDHVFAVCPPHRTRHSQITLSARLIHRSSPESPLFDPKYTRNNHVENAARGSLSRSRFFSQNKATSGVDYISAPVNEWTFIMKYAVGTPPVDRYGVLDTGSTLVWFQCLPCTRCYNQGALPIFDPNNSSSYKSVVCDTPQCDMVTTKVCGDIRFSPYCYYKILYGDGTTSRGIVSIETLIFSTNSVKKLVFGCGNDNEQDVGVPGVVGVGNHSSSLLKQLSYSHFSYFLFANSTYIGGDVHFGPGASLSESVANTPLIPSATGFYYLNLTGISVNGADLDLPPGIFDKSEDRSTESNSGFIIDSGTTFTILRPEAFDKLKDAIMDEMYMYESPVNVDFFDLCYKNYKGGGPEVTFMFHGLDYPLCESNLWVKRRTFHCLAILKSTSGRDKMSILGIHQQRNVEVGYDLEKNLLTLNYPEACPDDAIDFLQ